jgi:hypothetical protein
MTDVAAPAQRASSDASANSTTMLGKAGRSLKASGAAGACKGKFAPRFATCPARGSTEPGRIPST